MLNLLICRFALQLRQIKIIQGKIYLYVCCLGSLISFTVTADYPRITGLFNTLSLQTFFLDISLGKLNHSLDVVTLEQHLTTCFSVIIYVDFKSNSLRNPSWFYQKLPSAVTLAVLSADQSFFLHFNCSSFDRPLGFSRKLRNSLLCC